MRGPREVNWAEERKHAYAGIDQEVLAFVRVTFAEGVPFTAHTVAQRTGFCPKVVENRLISLVTKGSLTSTSKTSRRRMQLIYTWGKKHDA